MTQEYLLVYRMPAGYTLGNQETAAAWQRWFDTLGGDLVDRGKPAINAVTVGHGDTRAHLGGYSVIRADSPQAARDFATKCPAVDQGGGVEVAALVNLRAPSE